MKSGGRCSEVGLATQKHFSHGFKMTTLTPCITLWCSKQEGRWRKKRERGWRTLLLFQLSVYRRQRVPQHIPAYVSWAGMQSAILPQRSSANRNGMVMLDLHWAWLNLRGWGRGLASLSLFWPNQNGFYWLWREELLLQVDDQQCLSHPHIHESSQVWS